MALTQRPFGMLPLQVRFLRKTQGGAFACPGLGDEAPVGLKFVSLCSSMLESILMLRRGDIQQPRAIREAGAALGCGK